MIMAEPKAFFPAQLPNGRTVNVATQKGANEYCRSVGTTFLTACSSKCEEVHLHRKSVPPKLVEITLFDNYMLIGCIAQNASPRVFQSNIPKREFRNFFMHANAVLSVVLTTNPAWTEAGFLPECYVWLLHALRVLTQHFVPVQVMMELDVCNYLANFFQASKKPPLEVAKKILDFTSNVLVNLTVEDNPNANPNLVAVPHLEATGLLGQAIRCFLIIALKSSSIHDLQQHNAHILLGNIQECSNVVRERLKVGKPTGDIIRQILLQEETMHIMTGGRSLHPLVQRRLENLQKLTTIYNGEHGPRGTHEGIYCRNCVKSVPQLAAEGKTMMRCGRCKSVWYCSRKCRAKHWKAHWKASPKRKAMTEHGPLFEDTDGSIIQCRRSLYMSFCQEFLFPILEELYRTTKRLGVEKSELVMELDFFEDAPALRGAFKIGLKRNYVEGNRPDEPNWLRKGEDEEYDYNVQAWIRGLQDHFDRGVTKDDLIITCRNADGSHGSHRVQMLNARTYEPLFSEEAMNAVGSRDIDRAYSIFGTEGVLDLVRSLG